MKCLKVEEKLCLAISYSPIHRTSSVIQRFGVLKDGVLKEYNYSIGKCSCGATFESVSVYEKPVDVISVDGELKLVYRKEKNAIMDVGKMIVAATEVKPSVEYTKLASGLYVPKGYVSEDLVRKLASTVDVKEQAKVLIDELQRKGFKFNYSVAGKYIVDYKVEVVGPDGDKGLLERIEDEPMQRSIDSFTGKWSPLGLAVLASSQH